jgi:CheY-like chemotaxis protein
LAKVENNIPDIILLDIMMPEMDGIEFCRELRTKPDCGEVPVIMVTTKGEDQKIQEAFDAGCNDYVTKPINKLLLLSKIKNFVA